jgi:hypothetical protein
LVLIAVPEVPLSPAVARFQPALEPISILICSPSFAPHLEVIALGRAFAVVENFDAVEVGLLGDAVDLLHTLVDFRLDGVDIGGGVGAVLRLHRQVANALQVVVDFAQRAFRGLGQGYPVVGVTGGDGQAVDVGGKTVGDRLAAASSFALLIRRPEERRSIAVPRAD